jgi:hypothetical protein
VFAGHSIKEESIGTFPLYWDYESEASIITFASVSEWRLCLNRTDDGVLKCLGARKNSIKISILYHIPQTLMGICLNSSLWENFIAKPYLKVPEHRVKEAS